MDSKLKCEIADGDWNSRKSQCEFNTVSNHTDCVKRTVKEAIGSSMTAGAEGAVLKGTKTLVQCYGEKFVFQQTYEKLEVSEEHSESFTAERTRLQTENIAQNTLKVAEQPVKRREPGLDARSLENNVSEQRESITCPKCGTEMKKTIDSIYVCSECNSKFIEGKT